MKKINLQNLGLSFILLLSAGCGLDGGLLMTVGPDYQNPEPSTARHWQAKQPATDGLPIAHQGKLSDLGKWWERFGDPVLNRLLAAAQKESASLAKAKAQIAEARGNLISSESVFLPSLDSSLSSSRSSFSFGGTPFLRNQHQLSVQSSWEIDLFGGLARQREASASQLESRVASWHDARVAVAAELANEYLAYRYCEAQVQLKKTDADSRQASAKLMTIAGNAGFRSPADVALANASAADGNNILLKQQAQCERSVKSLVALTGLDESQIQTLLGNTQERLAQLPNPPSFQVNSVPADVIRQRPDIAAAERNMAEASAKIGVEQANRFPKLSLSGNITPIFQNINGAALTLAETWSYGPTLSLPLFDAGKRAANVETAKAKYESSVVQYRAAVRTAVKEVEEALVRLTSADQRLPLARSAAADYQTSFLSAQKLYEVGMGNLIDAETARRTAVTAALAVKELEQERISAWIALYRAVGGSWEDRQTQESATIMEELPVKSDKNNLNTTSQYPSLLSGEKS
ncbi:nodulation protein T [Methyloglobulus morosus KoM1]|uniref:Nodulation protein T n=1 Tax=Methyloglobulus morosus KoM1 TaxID=1116472 RepID=V5E0N7_9GAMM|nr:efflux transporter outer membrane subunit [Methyloglobulus morosus]ESS73116.1 nodulation protein T [Methyloglobulus morosus KoM1]